MRGTNKDSPAVEVVRKAREKLAAKVGNDIRKYGEMLMEAQEKDRHLFRQGRRKGKKTA